jgi:predicted GIY-YIG superfamily endonuclease
MTDDLETALARAFRKQGDKTTAQWKNRCLYLLHAEKFDNPHLALQRLKEVRKMNVEQQRQLVRKRNPMWKFLNGTIMSWPPDRTID